ncbi:hypothetical protein HQ529_01345 [Candidatus Woesearchaeota archaeon]|nr:hypothetical protein [Candidatus Woesearchaeota archaeon]
MAKTKKTQGGKVKKKRWFPVFTIKEMGERFICELHTSDPQTLEGKTIVANLMNITGNPKNQNVNLKFEIYKINPEKGFAKPVSYNMVPSSIKRMIRRKKDRLDDSFTVVTADKVTVRIKPMVITQSKTKSSIKKNLRVNIKNYLVGLIQKTILIDLFEQIIFHKVQKSLKDGLKKTYPVSIAQIRVLEVVKVKKKAGFVEEKVEEVKVEEKVEEKKEEVKEEKAEEKKEEKKPAKKEEKKEEVKETEKKEEVKETEKEKPVKKKVAKKEEKKPAKKKATKES